MWLFISVSDPSSVSSSGCCKGRAPPPMSHGSLRAQCTLFRHTLATPTSHQSTFESHRLKDALVCQTPQKLVSQRCDILPPCPSRSRALQHCRLVPGAFCSSVSPQSDLGPPRQMSMRRSRMRDLCFIFGLTDITVSTTAWAQVFQSQP